MTVRTETNESPRMNDINLSTTSASTRRIYLRRNRKGNRTRSSTPTYLPLTTAFVTTNSTLLLNSSAVPINDLFAPLSYLIQYKYFFLIGLILLVLLCVISIVFLIVILRCTRGSTWKTRRQERLDKKRLKEIPDFLDDQHGNKDENAILFQQSYRTDSLTNNVSTSNGILLNDNVSNTFSIDPLLEQKIMKNNPPSTMSLTPMADATSIDTLRGSLVSSPSQKLTSQHSAPTSSHVTTTDSITHPDERAVETEKEDDLHDLVLKPSQTRYIKANTNTSSSNLPASRTSGSSIEQSIRRQERRAEEEERGLLHGSNSNLYEKELRRQAEQDTFIRKQHTNSQVSLVSRTSEDSCY